MGKQEQDRPVVLVVEDDELLLADAVEVVSQVGFEPVPAKNADDAIMILERRNDIRVIFTGQGMDLLETRGWDDRAGGVVEV
ncbi:MAG TPA: hypothetical protein VHT21_08600 [Stellaceae bacterium]|nr:hypothetical protein [Stellaceae bacterium]